MPHEACYCHYCRITGEMVRCVATEITSMAGNVGTHVEIAWVKGGVPFVLQGQLGQH